MTTLFLYADMSTLLLYAVTGLSIVVVGGWWAADWVMGREEKDDERKGVS